MAEIFDDWPEKYDQWFETPIGRLIKCYESKLVFRMLKPNRGEEILDAGCGTGIFTADILETGARVVGLELAPTMLRRAMAKCGGQTFQSVIGDMRRLPFAEASFEKAISITALEFVQEARTVIEELFRVTKPGGYIVVATSRQPVQLERTTGSSAASKICRITIEAPQPAHNLCPPASRSFFLDNSFKFIIGTSSNFSL